MSLDTGPYSIQVTSWPPEGRHILAQFDDETIVVYQAYRPETARWAVDHKSFGQGFSYRRMSWIKTNFLWMMYRSGWGTKEHQEMTLALRLRRSFFDRILAEAVPSTFASERYSSEVAWADALASSEVRLQWDPDHDPLGKPLPRRAIQLGLRGKTLADYGQRELLDVIDLTEFVADQRKKLRAEGDSSLLVPVERPYVPSDSAIARRLGIDTRR